MTSPKHDALPLPDFDHLPLASLIQRIRTLDAEALDTLLRYEREHADRLPVTEAMQARLGELSAGAEPSGGSPLGVAPEKVDGPPVPRQTSMTSNAPAQNPPSHGDPTNPAQPR
jgi:hypothetical protein